MPAAQLPPDEPERLAALQATGILDTPRSDLFDGLVRVAGQLFDAPIAAVSLVAQDRQWFKAIQGLTVTGTPRDVSFCAHAILDPAEVLCVPDASIDPRFADNALVTAEPHIRFYAGAPITDSAGNPLGAICVIDSTPRHPSPAALAHLQDVAASVSAAIQLHALHTMKPASLDPLTGLQRRPEFDQVLASMLEGVHAPSCALLLLDIDDLKGLNELFGHSGGNLAIAEVGRRLATLTLGVAFHLAADTFAILASATSPADRAALCTRIRDHLAAPYEINGLDVPLRVSIGAAAPSPRTAAEKAETLFRQADAALRHAKHQGGDCAVDADWLPAGPVRLGRIDLGQRLREALVPSGREPFLLEFQPILDLTHAHVAGMEALVRWHPAGAEPVSPGEFVPLAERNGLVSHLDRWVLGAACRAAVAWPQPWPVSVNISAVSFSLIDVAALVAEALANTGLSPARLTVEMTETALAREPERTRQAVLVLRSMGVRVALDDFGAGHGSLTTLRSFPFTELKLDRGLIHGVADNPDQAHMIAFVAQLGLRLGVGVVAEGVETPQDLAFVRSLGATHVQGRLLSWPVPTSRLPAAAQDALAALTFP